MHQPSRLGHCRAARRQNFETASCVGLGLGRFGLMMPCPHVQFSATKPLLCQDGPRVFLHQVFGAWRQGALGLLGFTWMPRKHSISLKVLMHAQHCRMQAGQFDLPLQCHSLSSSVLRVLLYSKWNALASLAARLSSESVTTRRSLCRKPDPELQL